jgi:hypothetical protein
MMNKSYFLLLHVIRLCHERCGRGIAQMQVYLKSGSGLYNDTKSRAVTSRAAVCTAYIVVQNCQLCKASVALKRRVH